MNILMGIPVFIPSELREVCQFTPYKNSIQVTADCCGCLVWQGPSQQLHKAEHPETKICCAICLAKQAAKDGEMPTVVQLTNKGAGE